MIPAPSSQSTPSVRLCSALGLLALVSLELVARGQLQVEAAFPSLFSRPSLFGRGQQQQAKQPQQLQLQQQAQLHQGFANQADRLVPLANSQAPIFNGQPLGLAQYQLGQLQPTELMRISGAQQQQQQQQQPLISVDQLQHQQEQLRAAPMGPQSFGQLMDSAAQVVANYKPSMGLAAEQQQQGAAKLQLDEIQPTSFDLYDNAAPDFVQRAAAAAASASAPSSAQTSQHRRRSGSAPGALHPDGTHTSEVVDKIEQHIGRQIEQDLAERAEQRPHQQHQHHLFNQAAASGYHHHHHHHHSKSAEKVGAASGEGGEESGAEGASGGEEKVEKRVEAESEPEAKEEHHHQHHAAHHMEHPPEAFEIHHKKGGKSYQYFHQGHSQ